MQVWDAIVVGAGPAGCAAAFDLVAAGRSVMLLDKAQFPRQKACAGGLTMKAVRALRYSIAPVVRRTVREITLEHGDGSAAGRSEILAVCRSAPVCVMTIRAELDAYCLEQTRARGAVFRQVGALAALREESDCVLLFAQGQAEPFAGRLLLGADGVHSRVRALAGEAGWFRKGFALEANVPYSATGQEFPLTFDFAPVAGGYGWLFPRDTHVNVGLYVADAGAVVSPGLEGAPSDAEAPRTGARIDRAALVDYIARRCGTREHEPMIGQFLGLGGAHYLPAGTRVLLAGDAGGFVDPLTGEGIYGAIASGQAAAKAMLRTLTRRGDAGRHYYAALAWLRGDLLVAESAAARFYPEPERGFRLMRVPAVRRAVLHAYSEGTSLALLARGVRAASQFMRAART